MIDLNLTKLSVLLRVAEAYASDNVSGVSEIAKSLYPSGRYPLVLSTEYPLPLHLFSPRLSSILAKNEDQLDAMGMWNLISARENIIRMISASELERTAAESLGKQFEVRYPPKTDEQLMKRKQMIGYMIKVAMECFGYLVYSSRMQVSTFRDGADPEKRKTNYFTTASRYAPFSTNDAKKLAKLITDDKTRTIFKSITDLIISGRAEYQKLYKINNLSYWNTL
ncbi:MAG: hypothetical protein RBS43_01930 [Candidatus Cloacimonas sp.]|jgi:hypothetical protein|nr:hypothetical protein [Candidatus Cloacimonas sp.]